MRWLAVGLSVVLLLGACAHTVEGAARAATSALAMLPTEDEITSAARSPLSTFGFPPFSGGVEILPDGYRTDADASPIGCAAVTDTAPRIVYEPLPVLEAARQSYFNWDEGVDTSGADVAVVRLSTGDVVQSTFESFVRQWKQCDGTTVVKHVGDTVIDASISDVTVQSSVVSATVGTNRRSRAPTSRYERALGVRDDAIVEVSLAITAAGERRSDPHAAAVRIVQLILAKTGESG